MLIKIKPKKYNNSFKIIIMSSINEPTFNFSEKQKHAIFFTLIIIANSDEISKEENTILVEIAEKLSMSIDDYNNSNISGEESITLIQSMNDKQKEAISFLITTVISADGKFSYEEVDTLNDIIKEYGLPNELLESLNSKYHRKSDDILQNDFSSTSKEIDNECESSLMPEQLNNDYDKDWYQNIDDNIKYFDDKNEDPNSSIEYFWEVIQCTVSVNRGQGDDPLINKLAEIQKKDSKWDAEELINIMEQDDVNAKNLGNLYFSVYYNGWVDDNYERAEEDGFLVLNNKIVNEKEDDVIKYISDTCLYRFSEEEYAIRMLNDLIKSYENNIAINEEVPVDSKSEFLYPEKINYNTNMGGKDEFEEYLSGRPNIARIFDELNLSLFKNISTEKLLKDSNLMSDGETRKIVSQGFNDISRFLDGLDDQVDTLNWSNPKIQEEFKSRHGKEMSKDALVNNFCTNCGTKIIVENKFCTTCGEKIIIKPTPSNSGLDIVIINLHPDIKKTLEDARIILNKIDGSGSELDQLEKSLFSISNDWNNLLISRASWRTMSVETLKSSYMDMAIGHSEEYLLKYENGKMDIEGINYRIGVYNSFINNYEKYFKACIDSKTNVSDDINNRFLAVVESLIGAEITLLKMVELGETYDLDKIYERVDKPNSETIKDLNLSNTEIVDIKNYTYYKGYIFNGYCNDYNESNLLIQETPFRFGLKHGEGIQYHENGNISHKIKYFNDKLIELDEFDSEGKLIEKEKNTKNKTTSEKGELLVDALAQKLGKVYIDGKLEDLTSENKYLNQIKKLEIFSNFTDIQIRNTQVSVFCSAVWHLINADGEITVEETIQFMEFAKKMGKEYMGDEDDKSDPVIAELIQDPDKVNDVLKSLSEEELENFWSTLFSFALVDGDFSVEEANFIAEIVSNVYEDFSDDDVRDWITERIKKS